MPRLVLFLLTGLILLGKVSAQSIDQPPVTPNDSLSAPPIIFTPSSASEYIRKMVSMDGLWRPSGEFLRLSLARLIDHYHEPFDSVANRLTKYDFDSVALKLTDFVKADTLPVKWLNSTSFIIDTVALDREPFLTKTILPSIDSTQVQDPMLQYREALTEVSIDSMYLKSHNIQIYQVVNERIVPPLALAGRGKSIRFVTDPDVMIISERTQAYVAETDSPFYKVPGEGMPDSLDLAVKTLLSYTSTRDSVMLYIQNLEGHKVPFWLTSGEDELYRFWVKNSANDSITIWMGNPSRNAITLILEDHVNVERREKKMVDDLPIITVSPQRTLAKLKPLEEIPVYWKFGLTSAFTLNQTYLSNWARGGQNSLATMLDIRRSADYTNTAAKTKWTNNGRLRYGSIRTEEHGFRTNTDLLEFNSQYNKVIREKIDFSTAFYGKTQVAKGYKYPNDSVVVSRFLNPGTFTIGVGIEYKPSKETRINVAPLSYKNTFVLDTANINQRNHGIAPDRRTRQEMGGQVVIQNTTTIMDGLTMGHQIRLFSGYLDKPQNIDIDWEMVIDKRINWFFNIRLNMHVIYDDDIRFPVTDENDQPVLLPDGTPKRVPKIQYKQFLGLTLSFRI